MKRQLTEKERYVVSQDIRGFALFENTLSFDRIWLVRGGILTTFNHAVTIDHKIYMPIRSYKSDYTAHLSLLPLLCHELTHVWQYQNRKQAELKNYRFYKAGVEQITSKNPYLYTARPGSQLTDYGYEQQGQIVQDFVLSLLWKRPNQILADIIKASIHSKN